MSVPVITFFNNKGGVGKTSLVYHLSWMLSELGHRVVAIDLDPQANLTAAFLDEDVLFPLWDEDDNGGTVYDCVRPLTAVGDLKDPKPVRITKRLHLVPGDLALSGFEEVLSDVWPGSMGDKNLYRPFRILTAFWQIGQRAAESTQADFILADVGPNLGAINRSALIGSDHVVIPLGADLFSLQGLKNLGPTLREWRGLWQKRLENWRKKDFELPTGRMRPLGYIVQQHSVRLHRPVKAFDKWVNRMPHVYARSVLEEESSAGTPANDPHCLATLKHYRSLIPMALESRKPIFDLTPADGAIGAHAAAVNQARADFSQLAETILMRIAGISIAQ
jgi:cellulose biosynthesis protein BcsQ